MKILQIGSGSMGTRRLRDLHENRELTIGLYDPCADRRKRAQDRFGLAVFERLDDALAWDPAALVISTPPGTKESYVKLALERGLHHFAEADIWTHGAAEIERVSRAKGLISAPSASLNFLPVVQALGKIVREELGAVLGYQCCMATYMPGWHATEGVEYYARHRDTAPAREMIPFELTWLNPIFGAATEVAGRFEKYGVLPGKVEDTWSLGLRLESGGIGQLTVTMACPVDYRRGACFGANGTITWDIYSGDLVAQMASDKAPRAQNFGAMLDVIEAMYLREIDGFIAAVEGRAIWPQSYAASQLSVAAIAAAERSFVSGQWVKVDRHLEPSPHLPG